MVVAFGSRQPLPKDFFAIRHIDMGRIDDDEQLRLLYSAADVTAVPSRSENFPNVVLESMACGTPCVGFAVGGIPDMIEHRENGFLAEPCDPSSLADGVVWVLGNGLQGGDVSSAARSRVINNFSLEAVANRHLQLYAQLVGQAPVGA